MRRGRPLAWTMLTVWGAWLSAAQAVMVSRSPLGPWAPDLTLILLVVTSTRLHRRDVAPAAFLLALGRVATTVDPPAAILAGFLSLSVLIVSLRRLADVDRPAVRMALGGGSALVFALWMSVVRSAELGRDLSFQGWRENFLPLLPGVVVTALGASILFTGLVHLPGMTPLRERSRLW